MQPAGFAGLGTRSPIPRPPKRKWTGRSQRPAAADPKLSPMMPVWCGQPTQVLAQEVLKSGLYIEPWRQAINAYERAAEAGGPTLRFRMP
jgi:hypothetical protein